MREFRLGVADFRSPILRLPVIRGSNFSSLGRLTGKKIRGGGRERRSREGGLHFLSCRLERVKMFALQFGQLARVMAFAGSEDEKQTGEHAERREPRTKHAREE